MKSILLEVRAGVDIFASPIAGFLQKLQDSGFQIVQSSDQNDAQVAVPPAASATRPLLLLDGLSVSRLGVVEATARGSFALCAKPLAEPYYDYGISLGGDGTFLRLAQNLYGTDTPLLGINFGHVGFLADFDVNSLDSIADSLINGTVSLRKRYPINVEVTYGDTSGVVGSDATQKITGWALNEAALEKNSVLNHSGLVNLQIDINNTAFSEYGCDGLIVSTALGSTAHAFSAGGPIIYPNVECFELLPIAAHALFTRPVILDKTAVVSVKVLHSKSTSATATLTLDGARQIKLPHNSVIKFTQGATPFNFAVFDFADEFSRLSHTRKLVERFNLPVKSFGGDNIA